MKKLSKKLENKKFNDEIIRNKRPNIAHIFTNVDMRGGHLALKIMLEKKKIEINNDYVIFLNRYRNIVKMFCKGTDVILHYKSMRKIDPGVLAYLPNFCNEGRHIDFNNASKEHLKDVFKRL